MGLITGWELEFLTALGLMGYMHNIVSNKTVTAMLCYILGRNIHFRIRAVTSRSNLVSIHLPATLFVHCPIYSGFDKFPSLSHFYFYLLFKSLHISFQSLFVLSLSFFYCLRIFVHNFSLPSNTSADF